MSSLCSPVLFTVLVLTNKCDPFTVSPDEELLDVYGRTYIGVKM